MGTSAAKRAGVMMVLALATLALAMSPLEMNDPAVDQGTQLFEEGKYEEALKQFQAGVQAHPNDPRAHFNVGAALHKLGQNAEAKKSLDKALELDRGGTYANQIHYNLGNVAHADGRRDDALKEYRKALRANPNDTAARHNMEMLLKNIPPKQQNPDGGSPDGGSPDAGRPDAGTPDAGNPDAGRPDGGADGGSPDAGSPDAGSDGGSPDGGGDGGADGGNSGDAGAGDGGSKADGGDNDDEGDKKGDGGQKDDSKNKRDAGADDHTQDGGAEPQEPESAKTLPDGGVMPMSKEDAEKALDALKNNEKNLQLWRFRQKGQKSPNGKDW